MRLIVPLLAVGLLLAACTTTSSDAHIARKIEGTWTHNIPWIDGQERTLTLKASRDAHGKLSFDFIHPPFSYKPVFTALAVRQGRVEIPFKMVLYADESDVSPHTLKYVLTENGGVWSGQFFQSWVSSPVNVTLKRKI
jgi:hypothetical protein